MPARGQFLAIVAQNTPLCREHFRLTLKLPADFPPTEPGQFVQLACRELDHDLIAAGEREIDWEPGQRAALRDVDLLMPHALLRRPFSLAGRTLDRIDIIHRVVGVGTEWLSRLRSGDRVSLIGPLGNQFTLPGADQPALLIGGGVGIPPMLYLAEKLAREGRRAIALAGALRHDLLPLTITSEPDPIGAPTMCIAEFARRSIPTIITTDDGSAGMKGFVTQALQRYLDNLNPEPSSSLSLRAEGRTPNPVLYTCGPELMMKRVAAIAAERNLECQIAVERAMACGMGTCQSCCIRVKKPDPNQPPLPGSDWCYRLACTDGPVFRAAELLW